MIYCNSFEEMPVWQRAKELAISIFKLTEKVLRRVDYGLTSLIRDSFLSVLGNIAKGFGRKT